MLGRGVLLAAGIVCLLCGTIHAADPIPKGMGEQKVLRVWLYKGSDGKPYVGIRTRYTTNCQENHSYYFEADGSPLADYWFRVVTASLEGKGSHIHFTYDDNDANIVTINGTGFKRLIGLQYVGVCP